MTVLRDKAKRQDLRQEFYERLGKSGVPLSEAVKILRKILAKDQTTFSREVGIAVSTLRKIEQNSGNVTLETVERILDKYSLELTVGTKQKP